MKASRWLVYGSVVATIPVTILLVMRALGSVGEGSEVPKRPAGQTPAEHAPASDEALEPLPLDTAGLRDQQACAGPPLAPSKWPIASGYRSADAPDVERGQAFAWDVVQVNNGGHYDADTGRFTAPIAGIYELCANLTVTNGIASARLRLDGAFIGPQRWFASPSTRRFGRDCQVFTAKAGAEFDLVVQSPQQRCEESYCNFTTRLLAPACPAP